MPTDYLWATTASKYQQQVNGEVGETGLLTAVTSVGATSIPVSAWPSGILHGALVVIDPYTSECEVRRVSSVAGGVISFASALNYTHAKNDEFLISVTGEINALWFGASPYATAAVNGVAFSRMVAQAKIAGNPRQMYIPGSSAYYYYDTTIKLDVTTGLTLRGDGKYERGTDIANVGTALVYNPTNSTNAIELLWNEDTEQSKRQISVRDLTVRCNRAGGHTGCGIYIKRVAYTRAQLRNVSVAYAGIGIRTVDSWGSTWENVEVSHCGIGASIQGMNAGLWIGGGANECITTAVLLGDAADMVHGNSMFKMQNLSFEGNDGDVIVFSRTADHAVAPEHIGTTIDCCYFEANEGWGIKLGDVDSPAIQINETRVGGCRMQAPIYVGQACEQYFFDTNTYNVELTNDHYVNSDVGVVLSAGGSEASYGVMIGRQKQVSIEDSADWGTVHRLMFLDAETGAFVKGVNGSGGLENRHALLQTPRVRSVAVTATTANWGTLDGATLLKINHASPTDFTAVTNCPDHTLLILKFQTANTTVKHDPTKIWLNDETDWNAPASAIMTLLSDGGVLYEVSRSVIPT